MESGAGCQAKRAALRARAIQRERRGFMSVLESWIERCTLRNRLLLYSWDASRFYRAGERRVESGAHGCSDDVRISLSLMYHEMPSGCHKPKSAHRVTWQNDWPTRKETERIAACH